MLPQKLSTYLSQVKVDNFFDVVRNNDASLVSLKKKIGEEDTQILIACMIGEINGFYNVSNRMSTPQTVETAKMIVDEFYALTISDIKLFTKYDKMGVFGEVYRMDGAVIMRWLSEYFKMRMERMEGMSISESKQKEKDEQVGIKACPKEVSENINNLFKKLKHRKYDSSD